MSLEPTSSTKTCAIGLDVGGTKIAGGVVDSVTGKVLARQVIPTLAQRGGEFVLRDALALVEALMTEARTLDFSVLGIGIGVCELVDPNGNVTSHNSFDWRGVPVQETFSQLAPAVVESDARAPALAEAMFGAGKPLDIFTYVTVGTGISYCLFNEGRPFLGARGNAITLASMPLTTTCTACGAVLNPILEEFASGPGIVARYNHQAGKIVSRAEEVIVAMQNGDPTAREIIQSSGEALGNSVGFLVNILDPEAVIVGGGLGLAGGLYWDSFVAATRAHIYADDARPLPILPAALGADAGLIGAAARIFQDF
ncbi:ROK family protein [soil metagenome]